MEQTTQTTQQRGRIRRRQRIPWRWLGSIGVLAAVLLLPLWVGALAPGDLDTSFSGDGKVLTDVDAGEGFAPRDDRASALALQPNGKIVVAGSSVDVLGDFSAFVLVRYHANGTLDTTFGGDGIVQTVLGGSDAAHALVLQPDGKIVVAGSSLVDIFEDSDFALVRYHANGTLDTTFGRNGKVLTDLDGSDGASALVRQPDGKLVVAGASNTDSGNSDFALVRYHANGTLDTTFGRNGKVLTDLGGSDVAHALVRQPDGKLVAAGYVGGESCAANFTLVRYHANGTLDTTFGGDGIVQTDLGGSDVAHALVRQPDGKLVAAGSSNVSCHDFSSAQMALVRYHTNGTLDTTFGRNGKVLRDLGGRDVAEALVLQPDGKIVVAGSSSFALVRYHANGTLDTTFGGDGIVQTDLGGGSKASALALQLNGKIVVAGAAASSFSGGSDIALARYHAFTCEGEESSLAWQSVAFPAQAQTFTVVFDAVPHQSPMEGVTGLALGRADAPTDLGVIVRFNPTGFLDARNGSAYQAARALPYVAGTRYRVRLVVNVPKHTYSVYVTPDGGAEQTLATNYAFRTEQRTVPRLDTWALRSRSGSHTVCNFALK